MGLGSPSLEAWTLTRGLGVISKLIAPKVPGLVDWEG